MGGIFGALATGIFAAAAIGGVNGLLYGNPGLFLIQAMDVAISVVYSFGMTYLIAKVIDTVMGLRVTEEEEYVGLDIAQHGESARV